MIHLLGSYRCPRDVAVTGYAFSHKRSYPPGGRSEKCSQEQAFSLVIQYRRIDSEVSNSITFRSKMSGMTIRYTDRTVASGDSMRLNRGRRIITLPGYSGQDLLIDPSTPLRLYTRRLVSSICEPTYLGTLLFYLLVLVQKCMHHITDLISSTLPFSWREVIQSVIMSVDRRSNEYTVSLPTNVYRTAYYTCFVFGRESYNVETADQMLPCGAVGVL